ncbi:MAG: translation elongation factor Ts [Elusimicrobia bacterium]|nr:translation elongation factor Ts [Elusimicrobiota bacterium]
MPLPWNLLRELEMADMNRLIVDLREKTGAGIMDCKKALVESNGKFEDALVALRKKGLADAAKKSARVTKEGLVAYSVVGKAGAIIELNSETDFVARTPEFGKLASDLARKAAAGEIRSSEQAQPLIQPAFEKLGENIVLRRLERLELEGAGLISGYIHLGGKKGALVQLSCPPTPANPEALAELAKELLLQIVGFSPRYLRREDVPAADVEREKEIYTELLRKEGKPEASIPKIIEGKINKLFYQSFCLLEQVSVRDNKTPVASLIKDAGSKLGGPVAVTRFARYQLGE